MKKQIEEVREDIEEVKKKNIDSHELIVETFDRATKRDRFHTTVLLIIILFLLAIIAYDSYQDSNKDAPEGKALRYAMAMKY